MTDLNIADQPIIGYNVIEEVIGDGAGKRPKRYICIVSHAVSHAVPSGCGDFLQLSNLLKKML